MGNVREKKPDSLIHSAATASTGSATGAMRASRESLSPGSAASSRGCRGPFEHLAQLGSPGLGDRGLVGCPCGRASWGPLHAPAPSECPPVRGTAMWMPGMALDTWQQGILPACPCFRRPGSQHLQPRKQSLAPECGPLWALVSPQPVPSGPRGAGAGRGQAQLELDRPQPRSARGAPSPTAWPSRFVTK